MCRHSPRRPADTHLGKPLRGQAGTGDPPHGGNTSLACESWESRSFRHLNPDACTCRGTQACYTPKPWPGSADPSCFPPTNPIRAHLQLGRGASEGQATRGWEGWGGSSKLLGNYTGDWNSPLTRFNRFRLQNTVSLLAAALAVDRSPSRAAPQPTLLCRRTLPAAGTDLVAIPGPPAQKGFTWPENPSPLHALLPPARRFLRRGAVGKGCPIPREPCQENPAPALLPPHQAQRPSKSREVCVSPFF